ncbi:MAG: ParB N-terminal domain-containing protein [Thaumarchaeota archaeon]|nr:ParB N-terminal domain-containing protein [Nitrososphaerota archaeon]
MVKSKLVLDEIIKYVPSEKISLEDVFFDENNPNKMTDAQLQGLEQFMERIGFAVEIWVNKEGKKYRVIDGEWRVRVLLKRGIKFVWAKIFEVKYSEIRVMRQLANKIGGTHDKHKDLEEFKAIFEDKNLDDFTKMLGVPIEQIERELEKEYDMHFGLQEDDEIPDKPAKPKSKLGEIYQLGNHRIMCGDCTNSEHVNKLLNGKKVDQLATDPPYGVDYVKKNEFLNSIDRGNRVQKAYANDEREKDYKKFFQSFLEIIPFADYNTSYIFMGGKEYKNLIQAAEDAGLYHAMDLVWVKNNHVLGQSDYLPKHELCFYGWKGRHKFYGPSNVTSVLDYDKPLVNDLHPTMKPVEMFAQLLKDGSKPGALVYEPFLGSGTTLIACENTGRVCYGTELDPGYVDVIIQRWENMTGKKAVKCN